MLALSFAPALFTTACASEHGTRVSTIEDTAAVEAIRGTWEADTPDGKAVITFCQDATTKMEIPSTPDEPCAVAAYEVRAGRPDTTDFIDLGPIDVSYGDTLEGGAGTVCDGVMAAPLTATMKAWCDPLAFHGAMILADHETATPYAFPYRVAMESDVLAHDPAGKVTGTIGELELTGELHGPGSLGAKYAPGAWCPCTTGQNGCGADDLVWTTVELRRIGPATCP